LFGRDAVTILKRKSREGQPVNPPSVLLADDNRFLLERVAELLAPSFDVVGTAHDGQDLVVKARRLAPDVIVTDITMPKLTGIEAVHQIRNAGLEAKVVFLTVHSESEFLEACLAEGANGYVLKTQMADDLIPAIHQAVADKQFVSAGISVLRDRP
jgi:DNA-binding NarL/FixJ family response regulator